MKLTILFKAFFESEKAGGLILILCAITSVLLANSTLGASYQHVWHTDVAHRPVEFWINDGLMAIFFLLIGLEMEREFYVGELSDFRNALIPIAAALGGMLMPSLLHFGLNHGTPFQGGMGIPMATDIAFSLGVLSLLGNRVPASLKVFLTVLAIVDDLGAILVIAIFYAHGFSLAYFLMAIGLWVLMLILNRLKVYHLWTYGILGIGLWYALLHAGIHATISGVLLAFAIPFGKGDETSPSYRLQHALHKPVALVILPLFALANTGITMPENWTNALSSTNSLGILLGLILGKPMGVFLFAYLVVAFKYASLPPELSFKTIIGTGFLAGIGFTMSIFITLLAFNDADVIVQSKMAIFAASILAGIIGFLILRFTLPEKAADAEA